LFNSGLWYHRCEIINANSPREHTGWFYYIMEKDDGVHTVYRCSRYKNSRNRIRIYFGQFEQRMFLKQIISGQEGWITEYVKHMIKNL